MGFTYGTNKTTNNKDNQILVKLLEHGFIEEDRQNKPGIFIDSATRTTRVYRLVGQDFWAFIGDPAQPHNTRFVFLEILFALARALSKGIEATLENSFTEKIASLSQALNILSSFPKDEIPYWIKKEFSEDQLFWIFAAMTAFFDYGI